MAQGLTPPPAPSGDILAPQPAPSVPRPVQLPSWLPLAPRMRWVPSRPLPRGRPGQLPALLQAQMSLLQEASPSEARVPAAHSQGALGPLVPAAPTPARHEQGESRHPGDPRTQPRSGLRCPWLSAWRLVAWLTVKEAEGQRGCEPPAPTLGPRLPLSVLRGGGQGAARGPGSACTLSSQTTQGAEVHAA